MLPDSQLLFPRPSADEILAQLTDFFYTDELQAQVNAELEQRKRVVNVLEEKGQTGDLMLEDIADVLQFSDHGLNAIISILGISQERFLGIITLKTLGGKPPGQSLGKDVVLSRIRQDRQFALELAQLFLHGQNDAELLGRFPPFELAKLDKQKLLLKHKALVDSLLRIGLKGRYDAKKGAILEKQIAYFLDRTCVQYTQGEISLFGISRKMDFVVPNIDSPFLLIESGLFETTARELSDKSRVESLILEEVERQYPHTRLIRVTDGVGWRRRGGNDLRNLIQASHYFLVFKTLDRLEQIVRHYVPRHFFNIPNANESS